MKFVAVILCFEKLSPALQQSWKKEKKTAVSNHTNESRNPVKVNYAVVFFFKFVNQAVERMSSQILWAKMKNGVCASAQFCMHNATER